MRGQDFSRRVLSAADFADLRSGAADLSRLDKAGVVFWRVCDPCPWWHRLPIIRRRVHSELP